METFAAEALEGVADGVVRFDAAYRFTYLNPAAARILGRPRELLIGKSLRLEFPELESTALVAAALECMATRSEVLADEHFAFLGARLEVRVHPSAEGVLVNLRDVTEGASLRARLEHTEAELRMVSDTVPAFLAYVDRNETYRFVNRTAEAWFGLANDALVGLHVSAMLSDADYAVLRKSISGALAGERIESRAQLAFPTGTRWVDLSFVPHLQGRDIDGAMVMALDVTERHRAELQARDARRVAEESSRVKDEFLAMVSHELRTPLNAILGWTSLILGGTLEDERRDHAIAVIDRNARTQAKLVEDLLDISRIITGKLRLDVQSVGVKKIVESAVDALRPAASSKGVLLEEVLAFEACDVMGDADRLRQVVFNLLTNAVRHTPRGGRVAVTLTRHDSQVEIRVDDTGEGIAPELAPHVFERFRQGEGGTTRRYGGLGLGLAIVKHVVELHGGTIQGSSDGIGRGASFVVRIPMAALRASDPSPTVDGAARKATAAALATVDLDGLVVLVVDDDDDTREVLKTLLEVAGARVVTASSTSEGFEVFGRVRPAVLLSDIGMPLEDGYTFIERIRALPDDRGGSTPAVALTAFARVEDRAKALGAGYTLHLAKPVDASELVAALEAISGRVTPRTSELPPPAAAAPLP